ncbi:Alpha/Beta hydrolase protein [Mycena galericulata]|nr:Alpha/Beta hydrolase protein [Mycena galericulata]
MSTEQYLTLTDGRTLAYEDTGDASSPLVVIFFHGVFGVGAAPVAPSPVLDGKKAHQINPTLAGWGYSSPRPTSKSYAEVLASDMTELINHLHPDTSDLRIYVGGGSYGTVPAQMLYGASFETFPLGRHIVGCLLAAPFSPFKWHEDYTKSMNWTNYMSVGPPGHFLPFQPIQRMAVFAISMKLSTVDKAEVFLRRLLFDGVPPEEQAAFARWRESRGVKEGVLERRMATNMVKSISKSWAGFIEVADVIHSDWGFRPDLLDEDHTKGRAMMIAASTNDELGPHMATWLSAKYKNSTLKWVTGKHLSALYEMDNFWAELMENEPLLGPGL